LFIVIIFIVVAIVILPDLEEEVLAQM